MCPGFLPFFTRFLGASSTIPQLGILLVTDVVGRLAAASERTSERERASLHGSRRGNERTFGWRAYAYVRHFSARTQSASSL